MIRKFNLSDTDNVMGIWLSANISAHYFISGEYWTDNYETVKALLPGSEILVYEEDVIRGFVGIVDKVYIAGLFVSKQFQNCGIGTKLIEECKKCYPVLMLDVYLKNDKAVKFYKNHGFIIKAKKENNDTKELEYAMEWAV